MGAPLFLKNKLQRLISKQGEEYTFTLMGENSYHEPVEKEQISVKGVYHETNSFITLNSVDAASVQRKKNPMILTILDESVSKIHQGDTVIIGNFKYRVSGVLDIQNYGVAADISLEMEV